MASENWLYNSENRKWETTDDEDKLPQTPTRRVKQVFTHSRKNKVGKDAQQNMKGYCSCGRPSGRYRQDKQYCSRYCYLFENTVAEGYKKKTLYECWRGTGKYSYNPPYPRLTVQCAWCNEDFTLTRSDENKHFCGAECQKQANRSARNNKNMNGSKKIGDRVRLMRILRWFKDEPITAADITEKWNEWFRNTSCSAGKASQLCAILEAKGHVRSIDTNGNKKSYLATDYTTPLKTIFGEVEIIKRR